MESLREMVSVAKGHFEKGEYSLAESCLKKVLQHDVAYADVYHMLGVIHHSDGRFASAIDFFQKALRVNPNYMEAMLNLAVLYNDLGRYKEARQLYDKLHKSGTHPGKKTAKIEPVLKGKLANLHGEVGDIYRGLGLYEQATDEYRKALELNDHYVDIRTKLGVALREAGKLTDSLSELKRACQDNGKYQLAKVQLGVTFYAMGKINDAKKEWNAIVAKDPHNEPAKMYLRLCEPQKS